MKTTSTQFVLAARVLHWLIALLILTMLFIGVGMVASVSERHAWLISIHKPLGITILILAIIRLIVRLRTRHRRCLPICQRSKSSRRMHRTGCCMH